MTPHIADAYINYVKDKLRVSSDDELARQLGIGKSTVASWRRRKAVPDTIYGDLHISKRIDYVYFLNRYIADALSQSRAGDKIILATAMILSSQMTEREIADWADWISDHRSDIFYKIARIEDPVSDAECMNDDFVQSRIFGITMKVAANPRYFVDLLKTFRERLEVDKRQAAESS